MRILFCSEEIIEICNGSYYSMNLGQHIEKYSYLGEVTCVCYCRSVTQTKLPQIDKQSAKFIFTEKEHSIKAKISHRQKAKRKHSNRSAGNGIFHQSNEG